MCRMRQRHTGRCVLAHRGSVLASIRLFCHTSDGHSTGQPGSCDRIPSLTGGCQLLKGQMDGLGDHTGIASLCRSTWLQVEGKKLVGPFALCSFLHTGSEQLSPSYLLLTTVSILQDTYSHPQDTTAPSTHTHTLGIIYVWLVGLRAHSSSFWGSNSPLFMPVFSQCSGEPDLLPWDLWQARFIKPVVL